MSLVLHVGIDDTDSPRMGCTTYIAALLVEKLTKLGCTFTDYPNLVRLNPNVPWKTRGNGAVCLRFICNGGSADSVVDVVVEAVKGNSDLAHDRTDPAVAYLRGEVPPELTMFSRKVIRSVVTVREAEETARRFDVSCIQLKGRKGIVGAVAAIGETLRGDHTYELIAYRTAAERASPRKVDYESVLRMDSETSPLTFNNVDPETGRVLITPRGRDPILYGIRGESPEIVLRGHGMIRTGEDVERWVIFRTNHGTDDHLSSVSSIAQVRPYLPAIVAGTVSKPPRTITGGHVIFELSDGSGSIDCAAYEPTGSFRDIVRKLMVGDIVEAYGGIRRRTRKHGLTLNLEKIKILNLIEDVRFENPRCVKCGRRMESAGKGQGYRCRRCKIEEQFAGKIRIVRSRDVTTGMYVPPPRAHRHLTKPLSRYGRERKGPAIPFVNPWHWP